MRDLLIDYYKHLIDRLETMQNDQNPSYAARIEMDVLAGVIGDIEDILMK